MKIKSQYYPVFFVIGILSLLVASIIFITNWIITEHIENEIESKLYQFQFYVESTKNQAIENKINMYKIIAKNQGLISAVEYHDSEAINSIIKNPYNISDSDFMLIMDVEENVLLKSGINYKGEIIGKIQEISDYKISLLENEKEHYFVCTIPVQNQIKNIGTISFGYLFNKILKNKNIDEVKYAILHGQNVLYSQFENKNDSIADFIKTHHPIIDAVLATSRPSDMFSTNFDGHEVYSKILPFGFGIPVYFVVSVSKSNEYLFLDTLNEYLLYIFIFCSLLLVFTFFVIANRYSKQNDILNSEIESLKEEPEKNEELSLDELMEAEVNSSEMTKDLKGTILISKIICLVDTKDEADDSFIGTFNSYHKIQAELIELYDGKVENIMNNQMIASFMGSEDIIEKSMQCAQVIMKLINKEAKATHFTVAIALNYGSIYFSSGEKSALFGKSLEITDAIIQVAKPGQILIRDNLSLKTKIDFSKYESKVWKFKTIKDNVRLFNIS